MTSPHAPPGKEQGKGWSSRSVGSPLQHRIFYALIRIGGRRPAYALLFLVAWYYALFRPSVRNRSRHYLSRRFPGRGALGRLRDDFRIAFELGTILVDRAVLGILGPGRFEVGLDGRERLQALLAEGHGLILVTAHVGCWQIGMSSLSTLGPPVGLLIHRDAGDVDRHFFEHGGGPAPYAIIDPAGWLGGTLEMLQRLKRGEVLCIMGDRVMGGDGSAVAVDFLGSAVRLPFSPYKLASATGAPVAVIFPYRSGPGRYALQVADVIRVPGISGKSPESFHPFAEQFSDALERFVSKHPYQFFNFFNMWEKTEPNR
ncbi:MAG TPA: lysophospholipid acyltransferase family protein [Candidatus Deferrimicrobiaceae bacterium]